MVLLGMQQQFSLRIGTIVKIARSDLTSWMCAYWILCNSKTELAPANLLVHWASHKRARGSPCIASVRPCMTTLQQLELSSIRISIARVETVTFVLHLSHSELKPIKSGKSLEIGFLLVIGWLLLPSHHALFSCKALSVLVTNLALGMLI